jgi:D-alanyl-D-alanine carboxypeptidase/D-alanyl-D-alanine-endopeptidase (penicillin-binding protein 4)
MSESKNGTIFFGTLPVAGRSGTLTNLCKDQPGQGRIVAKSGTMNRVKSYAGYVNSKSGKKIAFAITINNYTSSSSAVTDKIEKLLNVLAVY